MLFSAEISDFRTVHNVLRAIAFKDFVVVRPMSEGLKFTLEEMRHVEISAYVPSNMFTTYQLADDDVVFKISMKSLTECLNIFGDEGNPSLKLSYKSNGSSLRLIVKHSDENVTVDCEIKTMNVDDSTDVSLGNECNSNKVVINAAMLVEILQRLDNSADELIIALNPNPPNLTLSATGVAGESKVDISRHSDCVTIFECDEASVAKYAFSNVRQVLKVMNHADKVAVSTGETGLLGLQLVVNDGGGGGDGDNKQMYVEYYVTSQVDE